MRTTVTIVRTTDDSNPEYDDEIWIAAETEDDGETYAAEIIETLGIIERAKYMLLEQG